MTHEMEDLMPRSRGRNSLAVGVRCPNKVVKPSTEEEEVSKFSDQSK